VTSFWRPLRLPELSSSSTASRPDRGPPYGQADNADIVGKGTLALITLASRLVSGA